MVRIKRRYLTCSFSDTIVHTSGPSFDGWSIEYRPDYPDQVVATKGYMGAVLDSDGFNTTSHVIDELANVPISVVSRMLELWREMQE